MQYSILIVEHLSVCMRTVLTKDTVRKVNTKYLPFGIFIHLLTLTMVEALN